MDLSRVRLGVSRHCQVVRVTTLPGFMVAIVTFSDGTYKIRSSPDAARGSRIVVNLKDDAKEFADEETVKNIIQTHSYFVPYPLFLNGKQINTVQSVWAMSKSDVTEEMYTSFYKHISKAYVHCGPLFAYCTHDTALCAPSIQLRYSTVSHALHVGCASGHQGALFCRRNVTREVWRWYSAFWCILVLAQGAHRAGVEDPAPMASLHLRCVLSVKCNLLFALRSCHVASNRCRRQ